MLLLRAKPYRNGCSTTFLHLYGFKNKIGPCLVSHFEGKVGLHLDYIHCINQRLKPPSAFCIGSNGVLRVLSKFRFDQLCSQWLNFLCCSTKALHSSSPQTGAVLSHAVILLRGSGIFNKGKMTDI